MIPCEQCLKFPVCRHREVIVCSELLSWTRVPEAGGDDESILCGQLLTYFRRDIIKVTGDDHIVVRTMYFVDQRRKTNAKNWTFDTMP